MSLLNHIKDKFHELIEKQRARSQIYDEAYEQEYKQQLKEKARNDVRAKLRPNNANSSYGKKIMDNFNKPYFEKDLSFNIGDENNANKKSKESSTGTQRNRIGFEE